MNNRLKVVLPVIIFFFASCRLFCKNDQPSVARADYQGPELRTDGYYYGMRTMDYKGNIAYRLLVLYRNGVFQETSGGADPAVTMNTLVNSNGYKDNHYGWGAFAITGDQMTAAAYVPSYSCTRCTTSYYTIINDSTLKKQGIKPHPQYGPFDDTLHFVAFPKPDSTNRFY